MAHSLPVGSDAWTNGEEYGGEYADRIRHFLPKIDEGKLLEHAELVRQKKKGSCTLHPKFSVGQDNLVRKIRFDDGVEWIVRLRMPPFPGSGSDLGPDLNNHVHARQSFQSELDTMDFVR
jgi:hypothetical protein